MNFSVVIPARYASQRLPGKPLLKIGDKSMIERVYLQASKSSASSVVVATDHADIEQAVLAFGGKVCRTREDHVSGTDRLAEVVDQLALEDDAIVVNVQGDEPLIPPAVIDQVATNLHRHSQASVATVAEAILVLEKYKDPNSVKVVTDNAGMALYFSRAPIPWYRDLQQPGSENDDELAHALMASKQVQKHIGIYAYRAALLRQFVTWPAASLEKIEKLEQLRVMENGHKIHVASACDPVPGGVDTQADLDRVCALLGQCL